MNKLFSEFPPVKTQEWLEIIKKDLKDGDINKLVRKTIDGLTFEPFYRKENTENLPTINTVPGKFPFLRGYKTHNEWMIRQNFSVENVEKTNQKVLEAFEKDVNIAGLHFGRKFEMSLDDFKKLTENIDNAAFCSFENIEDAYYLLKEAGLKFNFASFNFDPLTYYAFTGSHYKTEEKTWAITADLLTNEISNIRPVNLNLHHYANAGATPVMQLAIGLALAAEYFDFITEMKVPLQKVLPNIGFTIALGSEYFIEVSKIRAFRYLYSKLVESFNPEIKEQAITHIHGVTLRRNKTIYDAYVNVLRTSVEAFAGVTAGVDSMSIIPFDAVYTKPNDFSQRISVNQQIILREEAYANKITDPAGGSYYIENVTYKLIQEAWNLFLKIQEQGGFTDALHKNFITNMINEVAQKEISMVETGRISILGTNKYPNRTENLSNLKIEKMFDISDIKYDNVKFNTIKVERLSEKFEQMRIKSEKASKVPSVFLLTYGNPAMRRARADFAGNFFAVAGFNIIDNIGFESVEQGIEEAKKSNAEIVVLCSSDETYLEMAQKSVQPLNNKILVVAGNPENKAEIDQVGIKNYIHVKSNVYTELCQYQKMLNI